jgi:hypothetical protein
VKSERLRRPKIPRAARSFLSAYGPTQLWILNQELEARQPIDGTEVVWTLPTEVAHRVQEAFGS